jgi:hypothetical protein
MEATLERLFGELDLQENHCMVFYYMSVFMLMFAAFLFGRGSMQLFQEKRDYMKWFFLFVLTVGTYYLIYFIYRIMFTMCVRTARLGAKQQ